MLIEEEFEEREQRRGRRHLDGSAPGEGQYLPVVAVLSLIHISEPTRPY